MLKQSASTKEQRFKALMARAQSLGCHLLIAKMLIILAPALVAACISIGDIFSRMLPFQVFQSAVHFGGDLIEFLASRSSVESIFEAQPVIFFIRAEIFA